MKEESKLALSRVAELNDQLRQCVPLLPRPHIMVVTQAVRALRDDQLAKLFVIVREFNAFSEENNPWSERDFGSVEVDGEKYFWKFDYYNQSLNEFKENGIRVLTLMHSSEY